MNNVGTALMNQQLLQKAADRFAQAYAADSTLALAKINEGLADIYLQKLPEAKAALAIAVTKAPNDPHTWYALGLLYRGENDPHKALDAFNKVLAIDPNDADSHYLAASIDLELNDYPSAVAEYQKALEINPLHASAEFGLARGLQREGKADEAKAAFAKFQHITSAKLGFPLSHNYGEEGRYARVEDAALGEAVVGSDDSCYLHSRMGPCPRQRLLVVRRARSNLQGATTLVVLSSGDDAVKLMKQNGTSFEAISSAKTGIHVSGHAVACAVGDFDNDGAPDLAGCG